MSRIALGTAQFGVPYGIANQVGQVSRVEAKSILHEAYTGKLDTVDTAIAYGESESCLGEAGINGFKIITKLPGIPAGCKDIRGWVEQQLEASLSRLCTDKIDGLLLHRPEQLLGSNGNILHQSLEGLKDKDLVKKIGISIYSPAELESTINRFRFDIVQAPFNVIDRRLLSTGWLQRLKESGIEIHTRSVFLQGLLLMNQDAIPPKFFPWSGILEKWHAWLRENNISALQASLAFSLSFAQIDRVVVGVDSKNQLLEILKAENCLFNTEIPNFSSEDEKLINPANWPTL
ncbi:aldo/keto reductase [Polynucleobacter sp. AM-26B4]|uniref:aldo/keto reductase n=1 Tax=Polynucleobacter sp. AM-26B4 TaxID=2689103 RepID=UPI001C0C03E8|nr:aldo/keto reductase [Polynucleobacter sp. AM-26B4]MBU3585142.1 aldo/keto reductase [Polynucleobacter sp. AM-26B4]